MKRGKEDGLRPGYNREELGSGVRGKHLEAYCAGTNLVLLTPEVAAAFPTDQAVNEALRSLIEVAKGAGKPRRPTARIQPSQRRAPRT